MNFFEEKKIFSFLFIIFYKVDEQWTIYTCDIIHSTHSQNDFAFNKFYYNTTSRRVSPNYARTNKILKTYCDKIHYNIEHYTEINNKSCSTTAAMKLIFNFYLFQKFAPTK